MALRHALVSLQRSIAPFATSRLLAAGAPRLVTTSAVPELSAAEAVENALPEPETVGWGSTRIGELLKAKHEDSGAWLWCSKDDWVIDAIRKMTHANVGSLLVFDPSKIDLHAAKHTKVKEAKEEAVVGIFTERDYLNKVIVRGRNSSNTKVHEVMTPSAKLVTVTPNHSVLDVMQLMIEKNFRHVPVVEGDNMAGMVSMRDVVHVMIKEHREEVGRLQEYISGTF